jgi:PadR family transcriptional regulator PadR
MSVDVQMHENLASELRRGLAVLAVLSLCAELQYGYSLKQRLAEAGLEVSEGTLYPLLRRLETQGLLESRWEVVDDQRPRRYYLLSAPGKGGAGAIDRLSGKTWSSRWNDWGLARR